VKRQLGYLAAAAIAIGAAMWLVVGDEHGKAPSIDGPMVGVYRIAAAHVGPPDATIDQPQLAGRAFIVRRDGPELVAGLCPDEVTCRRWLDETPAFRHSLASLPVEFALADADAEAVLSSAHVVGTSKATTTVADGRCRRRADSGSLEPTDIGLRLRRELAQTELVVD
jgi:hypothetical protein